MGKGIILDKERGVNPRMTVCPQCGGDGQEIILLGKNDHIHHCQECDLRVLGMKNQKKCPRCKFYTLTYVRRLDEFERVPGSLCDACRTNADAMQKMVAEGGVYWKCAACHATGALSKEVPLAAAVREKLNIVPPNPCGVEFPKDCPACAKKEVDKP